MKIACYTCVIGNYDEVKLPRVVSPDCDYFAFVDTDTAVEGYETFKIERTEDDPRREARKWKVLSHRIFPGYDATLWHDGEVALLSDTGSWVADVLRESDLAVKKHPDRSCLYQEAAVCSKLRFDHPEVITKQTLRYMADEYPRHNGLVWTNVLIRRNNKAVEALNEMWWKEIQKGSRRDQISFPYCAWKTGVNINHLEPYEHIHEKTFGHKKSERVINT